VSGKGVHQAGVHAGQRAHQDVEDLAVPAGVQVARVAGVDVARPLPDPVQPVEERGPPAGVRHEVLGRPRPPGVRERPRDPRRRRARAHQRAVQVEQDGVEVTLRGHAPISIPPVHLFG
jgi:hypothetical protein